MEALGSMLCGLVSFNPVIAPKLCVMKVHDGFFSVEPLFGIYCGSNKPSEIVSSQNGLFVKFVSDESDERSGFQLHFDAIKSLY